LFELLTVNAAILPIPEVGNPMFELSLVH
jgi:hypothetical protein